MINSIAIQGVKGSFHHIVSKAYFDNNVALKECLTFDDAVDSLLSEETDAVIMAIENSIAGSIIPNYALIDDHNLFIVGEYFLDIQHHLMALPGESLQTVNEVHSHPMALLQCKEFFKEHSQIRRVEEKDTAVIAQRIKENEIKGVAAIGSSLAAEIYGLDILAESIQTIKHNETRFVIVERHPNGHENAFNKASLRFELDHKRGSLSAILNVMSDCKLNLTKIQSLPKIETPWKYAFFVDVTFNNFEDYVKAKSIIEIMAQEFKVLGEYKNAKS